jgi:hypothetical protein
MDQLEHFNHNEKTFRPGDAILALARSQKDGLFHSATVEKIHSVSDLFQWRFIDDARRISFMFDIKRAAIPAFCVSMKFSIESMRE